MGWSNSSRSRIGEKYRPRPGYDQCKWGVYKPVRFKICWDCKRDEEAIAKRDKELADEQRNQQ
jgi:hypothetical protein